MTAHGQTGAHQRGLTLIEVMIALGLGLLIVAALGYLFVGNRQAFRVQDSLARLQENGRYALEVLGQDLRMAGYIGCAEVGGKPGEVKPKIHHVDVVKKLLPAKSATELDTSDKLESTHVLRGYDSDWAKFDRNNDGVIDDNDKLHEYAVGTDSLFILRPSNDLVVLNTNMTSREAAIPMGAGNAKFKAGDLALIADCEHADIVTATEDSSTVFEHGVNLSKAYGTDAILMPLMGAVYYIRNKSGGGRSLYRVPWRGNQWQVSEEVVENVKDLQIVYGVDGNGDGAVDAYLRADQVTDWARVLAVRLSLLLRGAEPNIATGPPAVFWDPDNDGTNDFDPATDADAQARRLLQVFTTTVALRNRAR